MRVVPVSATCPGCREPMHQVLTGPGVVAVCRSCGGFWLDNVACRAVIQRTLSEEATQLARTFLGSVESGAAVRSGYRERAEVPRGCPVCGVELRPTQTPEPVLLVDVCPEHGTFFDARELAAVISAADARELDRQLQNANLAARLAEAQMDVEDSRLALNLLFGPRTAWR